MKKFVIIFVLLLVVLLGLFLWSVRQENVGETKESGTLVFAPVDEA